MRQGGERTGSVLGEERFLFSGFGRISAVSRISHLSGKPANVLLLLLRLDGSVAVVRTDPCDGVRAAPTAGDHERSDGRTCSTVTSDAEDKHTGLLLSEKADEGPPEIDGKMDDTHIRPVEYDLRNARRARPPLELWYRDDVPTQNAVAGEIEQQVELT